MLDVLSGIPADTKSQPCTVATPLPVSFGLRSANRSQASAEDLELAMRGGSQDSVSPSGDQAHSLSALKTDPERKAAVTRKGKTIKKAPPPQRSRYSLRSGQKSVHWVDGQDE